jgi:GxxExxY protein
MNENLVGEKVLGCALKVHRNLAPGLLEGAYEACLTHELARSGLAAKRQVVMPVRYEDIEVELGYRLDLLVEDCVVVEVKAIDRLVDVHQAQVISYLRLGGYRLGYHLNFNVPVLKDGDRPDSQRPVTHLHHLCVLCVTSASSAVESGRTC